MSASFEVRISIAAEQDLLEIGRYLTEVSAPDSAEALLDTILERVRSLADFPLRGPVPSELTGVRTGEFRQTLVGRCGLIYKVEDQVVTVMLIADGRRDMQALLRERLGSGEEGASTP